MAAASPEYSCYSQLCLQANVVGCRTSCTCQYYTKVATLGFKLHAALSELLLLLCHVAPCRVHSTIRSPSCSSNNLLQLAAPRSAGGGCHWLQIPGLKPTWRFIKVG